LLDNCLMLSWCGMLMNIALWKNYLWHLSCMLEVFTLFVVDLVQLWGLILESLLLKNLFWSKTSLTVLSHMIKWWFFTAWLIKAFCAFLLFNMIFNYDHFRLIYQILNSSLLVDWRKSSLNSVGVWAKTDNLIVTSLQNWMNGKSIYSSLFHLLVLRSFH
jgi:hypothetical protein